MKDILSNVLTHKVTGIVTGLAVGYAIGTVISNTIRIKERRNKSKETAEKLTDIRDDIVMNINAKEDLLDTEEVENFKRRNSKVKSKVA